MQDVRAGRRPGDSFRRQVALAVESIGRGLAGRMSSDDLQSVHRSSVATVYRLLFRLFAESRGLLPGSLEASTDVCASMRDCFADLGLPPLAETHMSDCDMTQAFDHLCQANGDDRHEAYRNLDVRLLGETYEFLLDHSPSLDPEYRLEHIGRGRGRRSRGSYYTPGYVVDHILDQALGPIVHPDGSHRLASDEILAIGVIDPAMGSGNFLISAVEYLAAAYIDALTREAKRCGEVMADELAEYRAMVAEHCVHGVDLDPIAVEIARMSLLIESRLSQPTVSALREHLRCGDSLAQPRTGDGDFDVVIGNPPYIASYSRESVRMPESVKATHSASSRSLSGRVNTFPMFVERGLDLLSPGGMLSLLLPKPMLLMSAYRPLRRMLVPECLQSVTLCPDDVFKDAHVASVVITARKHGGGMPPASIGVYELARDGVRLLHGIDMEEIAHDPERRITAETSPGDRGILRRIREAGVPLANLAIVEDGINPGPLRAELVSDIRDSEHHVPLIEGRDVSRYGHPRSAGRYILWDPDLVKRLQGSRRDSRAVLGSAERFLAPVKIVTRQTAREIIAGLDTDSFFCTNSVHTTRMRPDAGIDIHYVLAILNSELMRFYYTRSFNEKGRSYPQVKISALRQLPIHLPTPAEMPAHDEIVSLVTRILSAKEQGVECRELEAQVGVIVWGLYGATDVAAR